MYDDYPPHWAATQRITVQRLDNDHRTYTANYSTELNGAPAVHIFHAASHHPPTLQYPTVATVSHICTACQQHCLYYTHSPTLPTLRLLVVPMSEGVKNAAGRCATVCRNNYFRVIFSDVCNAAAIFLMVVTLGASATTPKDAFSWSKFKLDNSGSEMPRTRISCLTSRSAARTDHFARPVYVDGLCC